MLNMLNLIFLGATMAANIVLYAEADLAFPSHGDVAAISFHREWWRDDGDCRFHGLVVPWARTWEEKVNTGFVESVLPPEPDKIAGYAVVVNKKECPGKDPEAMFRVSGRFLGAGILDRVVKGLSQIKATELSTIPEAERPKWLPQVMATIEQAAATRKEARDFLDFTQQALAAVQAAKAPAQMDAQAAVPRAQ